MKRLVFFLIVGLCTTFYAKSEGGPFKKGSHILNINDGLELENLTRSSETSSDYSQFKSTLDLRFTYFLINNHGIVARLLYNRALDKSGGDYGYKTIERQNILFQGYIYGYELSRSIGLYATMMLGIGSGRDFYQDYYLGTDPNDRSALLTAARLELGAYLLPFIALPILLQPRIGYRYFHQGYNDGANITSGLFLMASVAMALNWNSYYCKNKALTRVVSPYMAGLVFLTAGITPFLQFGTQRYSYSDGYENIDNYFNAGLRIGAGMFFMQYLAVLLELNTYRNSASAKESDYESIQSGNKASIGLRGFLPIQHFILSHFFGQVMLGFGRSTSSTISSSTYETINNVFSYSFGIGYNYFLTSYLALTAIVLYTTNQFTRAESNLKHTDRGPAFKVGISAYINKAGSERNAAVYNLIR